MNRRAVAAVLLLVAIIFISAALVPQRQPYYQHREATLSAPSVDHWLGTDLLGRDILSRLVVGGAVSMEIALGAAAIIAVIGISVGSLSGFRGGIVDSLLMRATEIFAAIPLLLGALLVVAIVGPGRWNLIAGLGLMGWPPVARITRASVLAARRSGYVDCGKLMGASDRRILISHVLPNSLAPVTSYMLANFGSLIVAEAALSFIGLGVPLPTPSWGNMLSEALSRWPAAPWTAFFPGLAVALTVAALFLLVPSASVTDNETG